MADRSILASKLGGALRQLPYLPRALRLVWAAARPWTVAWVVLLAAQGLLPVAAVYLTRAIVDGLVEVIGSGGSWEAVTPVLVLVAAMAGLLLLIEVLRAAAGWVRTAQSELVQDHISDLIHRKSATVDLAFYEMPEYFDQLHRARAEATDRSLALVASLGVLFQNTITLVAMGAVLTQFGLWLPLALLVSTVPALIVVLRFSVRVHRWRTRTTPDQRRARYYDWVLTSAEHAAELRLFDLGPHFRAAYQGVRGRLRREAIGLAREQSRAEFAAGGFGLVVTAGALAWMVWRAARGQVTLGDLALFYQAFNQGQRLMRALLENAGQIYYNILFLGDLFRFLELEALVTEPVEAVPAPELLRSGIRFDRVSFHYPGSERLALREFSLEIPAGRIAAIVGPNGAGKTTLIKLLCRFYDPDGGSIALDGVDLRRVSLFALRRRITVLFQQPVRYSATVAENIRYGDLEAEAGPGPIERAAEAAGAVEAVSHLPRGYDTLLGKWFEEGAELSVGEWQRIALARAFVRRAPIILLDEPTSAMDSWAELDWMERFRKLATGRTAIVVTHRFTTAMRADEIHVMSAGRIVESGTHDELLAREGLYARSWTAQMRTRPSESPAER